MKKEIIEMKENLLTWIEISRKAYQNNIAFFRNLVGEKVEIFSVVKANAYGHGVQPIVQLALESGIQSFAVHALEEAMVVRSLAPVSTILIMGPVWGKEALHEIIEQEFRLAVFDEHILKDLETIANRLNKKAIIHLKINSGTNRLGIHPLCKYRGYHRSFFCYASTGYFPEITSVDSSKIYHIPRTYGLLCSNPII